MSPIDYSRKENWYRLPEITKAVDAFYIYATQYFFSCYEPGAPDFAPLDNPEMLLGVKGEYLTNASVFADAANVFVPYYRQAGMRCAGEIRDKTGNIYGAVSGIPYGDIRAALDFYFERLNNGRPFIIAGHSQGAAITLYALRHYFREHPEYYARLVAAYPIGYAVTREDLEANPHLKFAAGEDDTGVIVSWNTEGPENAEENARNVVVLPNAMSINPLNWKLDETYAPAEMNLGSLLRDEKTGGLVIGDAGADAKLDLRRGVVVTKAHAAPMESVGLFGPQSYHDDDYTLYYNNIKDNVKKRVAAYLEKH